MKTNVMSIADGAGTLASRMLLFVVTLTVMCGLVFLFASFIDLVQTWAVLPQWSAALVD